MERYDQFFNNIAMHIALTDQEKEVAISLLLSSSIKKNQKILIAGNICRNFYFVDSGCLRLFSCDNEGLEHNVMFCPENWWVADIASFSTQSAAFYGIDALEDCELLYYSFQNLEKLYLLVPKFERFFRILIQNGFNFYQSQITANVSLTALERYALFQERYPKLEQRITQKHIASYLGVTPIFLSRIRKRKFQSKK
ncbi:Crp/Fnr family transcriptional regulator [Rhizosphaericola mali]|nr:Crp/Fnr family transcriptional regulator [Rhizosphaericola mali]